MRNQFLTVSVCQSSTFLMLISPRAASQNNMAAVTTAGGLPVRLRLETRALTSAARADRLACIGEVAFGEPLMCTGPSFVGDTTCRHGRRLFTDYDDDREFDAKLQMRSDNPAKRF